MDVKDYINGVSKKSVDELLEDSEWLNISEVDINEPSPPEFQMLLEGIFSESTFEFFFDTQGPWPKLNVKVTMYTGEVDHIRADKYKLFIKEIVKAVKILTKKIKEDLKNMDIKTKPWNSETPWVNVNEIMRTKKFVMSQFADCVLEPEVLAMQETKKKSLDFLADIVEAVAKKSPLNFKSIERTQDRLRR